MTDGLSSIKLGVHGVRRIEIRRESGASYQWLTIALIAEDGSRAEITAFGSRAGYPPIEQIEVQEETTEFVEEKQ